MKVNVFSNVISDIFDLYVVACTEANLSKFNRKPESVCLW